MTPPSTVVVYEFFAGGGFPAEDLPDGLAAEALGMLWSILADFRRWGAVRTVTALDPRFEERVPGLNRDTLPASEVIRASHARHEEIYCSLLKRCDAVLIIAPETGGILAALTREAGLARIPVLGSNFSAITKAGNKAACHRIFQKATLPTPETHAVTFSSAESVAQKMGYPIVAKPVDGVGSEGVFMVNNLSDLVSSMLMIQCVTARDQILLQSIASGIHVSASLLISAGGCLPLSLNRQLIDVGSPFKYLGSQVPFQHKAGGRAMDLACSAAHLIPGLRGYVGVDLVLTDDDALIIEINPRLTTSYIGLRQVAPVNLARAIWEACMKGILPDRVSLSGQVTIRKDDPSSWGLAATGRNLY
jgi:hypothetical protein